MLSVSAAKVILKSQSPLHKALFLHLFTVNKSARSTRKATKSTSKPTKAITKVPSRNAEINK